MVSDVIIESDSLLGCVRIVGSGACLLIVLD